MDALLLQPAIAIGWLIDISAQSHSRTYSGEFKRNDVAALKSQFLEQLHCQPLRLSLALAEQHGFNVNRVYDVVKYCCAHALRFSSEKLHA
jgi:hypothetical protein